MNKYWLQINEKKLFIPIYNNCIGILQVKWDFKVGIKAEEKLIIKRLKGYIYEIFILLINWIEIDWAFGIVSKLAGWYMY